MELKNASVDNGVDINIKMTRVNIPVRQQTNSLIYIFIPSGACIFSLRKRSACMTIYVIEKLHVNSLTYNPYGVEECKCRQWS